MNKINFLLLFLGVSLLLACARLDDIAFINDNTITEYLLDDYTGETEIQLPDTYNIAPQNIYHLTLKSQGSLDEKAFDIHALYLGNMATIKSDTVIVYCHGQSLHLDYYWPRIKLLANIGKKNRYGVLAMDYRGYGLSEGTPSEYALYEDVKACLTWLKQQGSNANRTVIYGFSLGSAPATEMAAFFDEYKPWKIILESPFASAENIAQESTLIEFKASYIVDLKINNAEKIKKVNQPFLWLHGEKDDYVKISNGEIIFKNYQGVYGEAVRVEDAYHGKNGVPPTLGYRNYLKILENFITH